MNILAYNFSNQSKFMHLSLNSAACISSVICRCTVTHLCVSFNLSGSLIGNFSRHFVAVECAIGLFVIPYIQFQVLIRVVNVIFIPQLNK